MQRNHTLSQDPVIGRLLASWKMMKIENQSNNKGLGNSTFKVEVEKKTFQIDLNIEDAIVMCCMGNWIYMFSFVIEDYFARYDKTCLNLLWKHSVVFEFCYFKKDSRKAVWESRIKFFWASESNSDKKNDVSYNHDNSSHLLWTFCLLVC